MNYTTKNLAFLKMLIYIYNKMSQIESKIHFLGDFASLSVGYAFRNTCVPGDFGMLSCFLRDIDSSGVVNLTALKRVENVEPKEGHLAVEGDVLFRSRGDFFVAAKVPKCSEKLLVVAPMIRIRVENREKVLPEYLVWYINGVKGAAYFKEFAMGTAMPLISKGVLEKMPLKLPSIEDQRKIIDLINLNKKEQFLMSEIAIRKNLILEREISNYLESL